MACRRIGGGGGGGKLTQISFENYEINIQNDSI